MPSSTSRQVIYGIMIEGIGDNYAVHTTDKRYRFSWGRGLLDDPASVDPDNLYLDDLLRWPDQIGVTVDWLGGNVGGSEMTFAFRGNSQIWNHLCRYVINFNGRLVSSISATGLSITITEAGLAGGTVIFLEREAIALGTEAPPGTYTATRGLFETMPMAHGASEDDDREYFRPYMHPASLAGRRVDLFTIAIDATSYADEEIIWTGVLREIAFPVPGEVELQVSSVLELVRSRMINRKQWRGKLGNYPLRQIFEGGGKPAAGYSGDKRMVLMVGDVGTGIAHYQRIDDNKTLAGGVLRTQDPLLAWQSFNGHQIPDLNAASEDVGEAEAWEVLTSHPDQPANAAVPANNTLPLSQDPATLILQLLLSTNNNGSPGPNHATYDTGIAMIAGAIPADLVDVGQIETWGRRHAGVRLDRFSVGLETKEVELAELISSKILRPLGAVLAPARNGKLSVLQMTDNAAFGETVTSIGEDDLFADEDDVPKVMQLRRIHEGLDSILVTWNDPLNGDPPSKLDANDAVLRRRTGLGVQASISIDMSAFSGEEQVWAMAMQTITRWHRPIPLIEIETLRTINVWPGDVVDLTHPLFMGTAGSRSLVAARCLVSGRTERLDEESHFIKYELRLVGLIYARTGYIAPSATVVAWASPYLEVSVNNFTDPAGEIPTDVEGFGINDMIQLVDSQGAVRDPAIIVTDVDIPGSRLKLDPLTLGVLPVAGDIVRMAAYLWCTAAQQEKWVFVCTAAGFLGAADNPKEWTMP